jgi:osmotically-inducible protein OsmY
MTVGDKERLMLRILAAATGGLLIVSLLTGCPAAVIGGAGATASVAHDRRTTGTYIEDQEIEIQAFRLLQNNPSIRDRSNISTTSYNLAVLLTGQAADAQVAAEFAALVAQLPRVKVVHNRVVVGAESTLSEDSSDAYVTSKVKLALFDVEVAGFDPTRVKVVTSQGVVYLMGLLTSGEADGVIEKVRRVSGVKRVIPLFETIGPAAQPAAPPSREQPAASAVS